MGITRYIWRSSDDDKVRSSHAGNDDRIFRWDSPPPTGHPGHDYGCRCWAEPVLDEAGEPWFDEVDVALAAATLVGLLAAPPAGAVLAATLARRVSINILRRALQRLLSRQSTTGIFKRPKGVPQDWIMKPADKGVGVVFTKPGSKGGTYVKIQKGNPNSSQPGQRYDNVRWQKDGQPYDVNANPVPRNSQESHIPVKDFKFDPELFK